MLTVIALCLMYLCVTTTLSVSRAQAAAQLGGPKDITDVNIVQVDGVKIWKGLPVRTVN